LLNATDATSIRRAIAALEPNAKYADLSASALARQRADWLVGMSATRAATITGRKHGYSEVLSIGRVQTPTLALVVARDLEIEAFALFSFVFFRQHCGPSEVVARFGRVECREEGPGELAGPDEHERIEHGCAPSTPAACL
jgi:DNA topoisomerase-3